MPSQTPIPIMFRNPLPTSRSLPHHGANTTHPLLPRCNGHCELVPSPIHAVKEWKGPGIVFTTSSPQVSSPTIWRPSWMCQSRSLLDNFTDSTTFYEEKGLEIGRKYLILSWDVNVDWRESESTVWQREGFWFRYPAEQKDAWWTLWHIKMRWVVSKIYLVTIAIAANSALEVESPGLRSFVIQVMRLGYEWETTRPSRSDYFHRLRVVCNRAAYAACIPIPLPLDCKFQRGSISSRDYNCLRIIYGGTHEKFPRTLHDQNGVGDSLGAPQN